MESEPIAEPINEPTKSKLYTRKGDFGMSRVIQGDIIKKTDMIFTALGSVDHLNSLIGLTRHKCTKAKNGLDSHLAEVQAILLDIGATLSKTNKEDETCDRNKFPNFQLMIGQLEKQIDFYDSQTDPLKNFILPYGCSASIALHITRTACRQAEKTVWSLIEPLLRPWISGPYMPQYFLIRDCGTYLNRLSDFLFACARYANKFAGIPDKIYYADRHKSLSV